MGPRLSLLSGSTQGSFIVTSMNFKCTKCGFEKSSAEFPFAKGKRHSWCRECHKAAKAESYRKFREANPRKKRISEDILTEDGCAICSKCKNKLPLNLFQSGTIGGWCQPCKTALEKEKRKLAGMSVKKFSVLEGGKKLCLCCNQMKELQDFSPTERGTGGVSSYCRPCTSIKFPTNREEGRKATAAYRVRHAERHKAAHRIRMFEYNHRKKVTADGSVTDALLKALYAQETCYYCGKETPSKDRTIEHRLALINGGTHTAGNVAMTCRTCNSSKKDMREEDFIKRIKQHEPVSKNY